MHSNKSYKEMKTQTTQYKYFNPLHKNLDKFIQNCLNKFKFVEPEQELYDICGDNKNSIISHKSTIPDLVIWNKTFNKNECFENSDTSKISPYPRYKFFLRFNQNKDKKKKSDKKKQKNKNISDQKNSSNKSDLKNISEINKEKILGKSTPLEKDNSESIVNLMEKLNFQKNNDESARENDMEDTKEKTEKKKCNNSSLDKNKIADDISLSNKNNTDFIKSINSHHLNHSEQNNKKINRMTNSNNKILFNNINNLRCNNSQSPQKFNNSQILKNSSFQNSHNNYQNSLYYESNYRNANNNLFNNKSSLFSSNKSNKYSLISSINNKKKTMNDYYQNQFKQNELLMNFVYSYLEKKGWIVFENNNNYICNFTSFELFAFLTNILKNNNDLKYYLVGMSDNSAMFNGEQIYIILSQTLPIILQKKQYDLMQHEKEVEKKNEIKEKENNVKDVKIEESRCNVNDNNKLDGEDRNENCGISEEDDNYYDFNLNGNNFFMNEQQETKYDNFDSSIFGQSHK